MFKPVNRYIQIKLPDPPMAQTTSGIVLPADFKPTEERYGTATVISYATDVRFGPELSANSKIVIDKSMVEEITIDNERINVVLDNYIVGIIN
jgi:co-chaperonin GroES (HSP10)